jgi:hypothetical protein
MSCYNRYSCIISWLILNFNKQRTKDPFLVSLEIHVFYSYMFKRFVFFNVVCRYADIFFSGKL